MEKFSSDFVNSPLSRFTTIHKKIRRTFSVTAPTTARSVVQLAGVTYSPIQSEYNIEKDLI